MNAATAAGLLHLIAAEPTLLAAASADTSESDLDHRARNEDHPCLGCGSPARCAVIVNSTTAGPRWLDLCSACWHTVRRANHFAGQE
ncbi:hypothetical protein [Streptomyces netropsis]|uniref:Formate dehydrogenase maturation protein FdhE n=1 Tax=Streptomyces netropsis TaxID=55404 RepID=A0A7W7LCS9_STRNE|nr:hypothetical protein [Streptomyces netropsis]MBB4887293.1 formate dehydrogenase maturation protein FdhE [Streptomyces netropsis]GGR09262.1 hypothetical protein GCM10010219_12220 [Streptomyces netropsis]